MEAHKSSIDQVVDVSSYTGMEVEHGHDTESLLPIKRATSVGVDAINKMA